MQYNENENVKKQINRNLKKINEIRKIVTKMFLKNYKPKSFLKYGGKRI